MNRLLQPLAAVLIVLALLAAGCSGSDSESENLVPLDAPAPGVLYVSTVAGDIQVVTPAGGETSVFVVASGADQSPVVDVAPAANAGGVHALVRVAGEQFVTEAADVTASGLVSIETAAEVLSCLDPHTGAATSLAHETAAGSANGAKFTPVAFAGGSLDNTFGATQFELISVACPRWSADRNTVATATPTRQGDPSSIVTIVQTSGGERHEIGFDGCGTTPTSFSPDDQMLAVSLTCFAAAWENSGLYLLPVDGLSDLADLGELTKLGNGLFGRTAWHPDGEWIAAVHADAIEKQNIAVNLGAQPVGLQVIEVATRQTVDLDLADAADPFSIAWLEAALSS